MLNSVLYSWFYLWLCVVQLLLLSWLVDLFGGSGVNRQWNEVKFLLDIAVVNERVLSKVSACSHLSVNELDDLHELDSMARHLAEEVIRER